MGGHGEWNENQCINRVIHSYIFEYYLNPAKIH